MRLEYSFWLLALVVLFVANVCDGVHGMVANHHRTHHHGEYFGYLNHVSLIILFSSDGKGEKKKHLKFPPTKFRKFRKYTLVQLTFSN